MLILTIRTDKPEAELSLISGDKQLDHISWLAHRELSTTIHLKIKQLLEKHGYKLKDLEGLIAYEGPGSFTGLRIGLSVANTLSYSLSIPIVGARGTNWQKSGNSKLKEGLNQNSVMPHYGALPHITRPRK
jgi:tRNA threonylcarbamoyladenosine biosynthesis protein TsaB